MRTNKDTETKRLIRELCSLSTEKRPRVMAGRCVMAKRVGDGRAFCPMVSCQKCGAKEATK